MELPQITVALSKFEKIEILRQEIELRDHELTEVEKKIRQILWELERQKYLKSVHGLFEQLPAPSEAESIPQLLANREGLHAAVRALQTTLQTIEAGGDESLMKNQASPSAPAGPSRPQGTSKNAPRVKFDTFEDFRTQRKSGPGS